MAALKNKKHLFFDLDDTLWDFNRNSGNVLKELYTEFELEDKLKADFTLFHEEYKKVNFEFWCRYYKREIDKSFLRNNRFKETFKKFNYSNDPENQLITEQYMNRAPHGRFLKEGCLETLAYLARHYSLHIITNGFKEIQGIKLDGCGLRDFFCHIIISEEHNLIKPEEKIFRLAETMAGTTKEECVMIGDNYESDVLGALNAGWEAIYLSENNSEKFEGRVINKLIELKRFF